MAMADCSNCNCNSSSHHHHHPPAPPSVADEDYYENYASQLLNSVVLSKVLQSVVQLGVFEIMAKFDQGGGLSAAEIVGKLQTSNPQAPSMLDRMLCLLASNDVFKCCSTTGTSGDETRFFKLAPVGKYFVKNEMGFSHGGLLNLLQDIVCVQSWFHLTDAVLEGGVPFDRAHGVQPFEYSGLDQRFNQVFNEAMLSHTAIFMSKMLEGYKGFQQIKQLVDVGGGFGVSLAAITSKYPHIKGINFDLPHVIQHAPAHPGVEHVGGDMFESVPSGDAIYMKWVLHDWSDDHCLKLLKNCYKALPDNGKVIVVEANLPEIMDTSMAAKSVTQMDMAMLSQNPGGKERRPREFLALAKAAGFSGIRHEGCFSLSWVMEFYK